jgi:PadR family transcriptional regulator PadR
MVVCGSRLRFMDVHRIVVREIVLGLWKVHILHHASTNGVVGHHMLQELREHGHDVSPGTLYPLLHRMERNGWLQVTSAAAAATHAARTYAITPAGAEVLAEVSAYVDELHEELGFRKSTTDESRHAGRGRRRPE